MVAGIRAETRSKYVIDRLLMSGRPLWVQVCWLLLLSISFGLLVGGVAWLRMLPKPISLPQRPLEFVESVPARPVPVAQPVVAVAVPAVLGVSPSVPSAVAPAPALVGTQLSVGGVGQLLPLSGAPLGLPAAAALCAAHGLHLPSITALQALWAEHTQGRPSNVELCSQQGWPLAKLCGGSALQAEYWSDEQQEGLLQTVNLFTGQARGRLENFPAQVACMRE